MSQCGYMGKVLRVDLSNEHITEEQLDETTLRKYLGGTGLGAKYLYDEVPSGVEWSDPENRLMWFSGPFGGTRVAGSGIIPMVTKGPMTELAGATQANGFFGAFMKSSGVDGIVIQGKADRWCYLYIHDGTAELRRAGHLLGRGTWETEETIKKELGTQCSVFSIGPAGENLVRFACVVGDQGHVAAHNGVGAVMGSKRLKAIVAERGNRTIPVKDKAWLSRAQKALSEDTANTAMGKMLHERGSLSGFPIHLQGGRLPIRNYTTSLFPEYEKGKAFDDEYVEAHFERKPKPCWACPVVHGRMVRLTEGPFKGYVREEPDYESMAAMTSQIGQLDTGTAIVLANTIDELGMDVNETSWVLGWVMECCEKGLLTKDDLDGLDMKWGNAEAVFVLLSRMAHRQGAGDWLAEGVKRVAERLGGEAVNCSVYTQKGAAPRSLDNRADWFELSDTCLSNTSTIEATGGPRREAQQGLTPIQNLFDPIEVSTLMAKLNGRRQLEDSLALCRWCVNDFQLMIDCLNAITGWDFDISEGMDVGRRAVNQLRMFNFRHGLTKEMEVPSTRYGSAPVDGPAKGISIMPHWDLIRSNYYKEMGWDPETGKPLAQTLEKLGLEYLVPDLK